MKSGYKKTHSLVSALKNLVILGVMGATQALEKCTPNCVNCMPRGCYRCKFNQTTPDFKCAGAIKIPNCHITQSQQQGLCTQCKEGFTLSRDKKSCFQTKIKNCIIAYVDLENREKCLACENSIPNGNNTLCVETNKVNNCKYTGRNLVGGIGCVNCDDGFSFNREGKCVKECTRGCLVCVEGKCLACNHFNKFFDSLPGVCKLSQGVFGVPLGLLLTAYWVLNR